MFNLSAFVEPIKNLFNSLDLVNILWLLLHLFFSVRHKRAVFFLTLVLNLIKFFAVVRCVLAFRYSRVEIDTFVAWCLTDSLAFVVKSLRLEWTLCHVFFFETFLNRFVLLLSVWRLKQNSYDINFLSFWLISHHFFASGISNFRSLRWYLWLWWSLIVLYSLCWLSTSACLRLNVINVEVFEEHKELLRFSREEVIKSVFVDPSELRYRWSFFVFLMAWLIVNLFFFFFV